MITREEEDIGMLHHKNEGFSISFLGVLFPTPPLFIPHFYDVSEGLSSSSILTSPKSKIKIYGQIFDCAISVYNS